MSADDRERWNARYAADDHVRAEPSSAIVALQPWLPPHGTALDVAGGAGTNALWMAAHGLDVTIVDIAERGLALARQAARARGVSLDTVCADLEQEPPPEGPWSVVLCSHYLQRDLIAPLRARLAPGGRLLWVHPTVSNLERHTRPSARFLLQRGEAERIVAAAGLVVRSSVESWVGEGGDARHLAQVVGEQNSR